MEQRGHGEEHKPPSPDVGRAWGEEGWQLTIMPGDVQRKKEQSYSLKELVQLQDVKEGSRQFPEDVS